MRRPTWANVTLESRRLHIGALNSTPVHPLDKGAPAVYPGPPTQAFHQEGTGHFKVERETTADCPDNLRRHHALATSGSNWSKSVVTRRSLTAMPNADDSEGADVTICMSHDIDHLGGPTQGPDYLRQLHALAASGTIRSWSVTRRSITTMSDGRSSLPCGPGAPGTNYSEGRESPLRATPGPGTVGFTACKGYKALPMMVHP